MTQQDYLYPKIPVKDSEGNIDQSDQENFNRNMLELFRSKVSKDNQGASSGSSQIYTEYIKQIIQNHVVDAYTYSVPATRATAIEIACLTTAMTTSQVDSKVAIDFLISFEMSGAGYDYTAIFLERGIGGSFTEIGSATPAGSRPYGIISFSYDSDAATTPDQDKIQYIDSPMVASGTTVTYRLKIYGLYGVTNLYINRSAYNPDAITNERITSNVRLMEFGGTPVITSSETSLIATAAEAIAGTNDTNIITPLKLRNGLNASGSAPIYACRAWVNFNGTGTVAIRASGNVSSITDNGTGYYTVNFTTSMEDASFSVSGTCDDGDAYASYIKPNLITTSSCRIKTGTISNNYDCQVVSILVFR